MPPEYLLSRKNCPICNSESLNSIFNRSFNDKLIKEYMRIAYHEHADLKLLIDVDFEIVQCKNCSFAFQKVVFKEKMLDELYNKWIDPAESVEYNRSTQSTKRIHNKYILKCAKFYLRKENKDIEILDYGAGFGDSLLLAKKMGFKSNAYEYSNERVKYLEEHDISILRSDDSKKFDFIILNQVLEHITNPDKVLEDIYSKLKPHGLLFISVPNCSNIEDKLKKTDTINDAHILHKKLLDASVAAFQHLNFFNNYNLKYFLKKYGFKPVPPYKFALVDPINLKTAIKPFIKFYFSTSFFLTKE